MNPQYEQIAQFTVQKPLCLFVLIPEGEALNPLTEDVSKYFSAKIIKPNSSNSVCEHT